MEQWFHGTFEEIIGDFLPMSHFGTRQAAIDLLQQRYKEDRCKPPAYLFTVELHHKKTLRISDTDSPEPCVIVNRLQTAGRLGNEEALNLKIAMRERYGGTDIARRPERMKFLADYLMEVYDCDSLEYTNEHEDKGSLSVAILDPKLIKVVRAETLNESVFLKFQ
jgi:hypothetical protein